MIKGGKIHRRTTSVRLKDRKDAQSLPVASPQKDEDKTSYPQRQPETPHDISTEELNRFHTDDSFFPSEPE